MRPVPRRHSWLVLVLATALGAAAAAPAAGDAGQDYTFVSAPDTWNADIGDVQSAPGWHTGDPNSIDASWEQASDDILSQLASHHPAFALVAGDLVNGHWYADADHL